MRKIIYIATFLLLSSCLWAGENEDLITQADKDYSEGLYNNAIENYSKVLQNGYVSAGLYYNLGNAYFKTNDLASAILYYEKARRLAPDDEDIQFNLNVANSRITDKIEEIPVIFYKRWGNRILNSFDLTTWARFNVALFIIILVLITVFFLSGKLLLKKITFWTAIIVFVFFLLTLTFSIQSYHRINKIHEAVVFNPSLTVKSSPTENSVDLFVVHEGTKVSITDQLGIWYEIRIANGSAGWVLKEMVKPI